MSLMFDTFLEDHDSVNVKGFLDNEFNYVA